MCTYSIKEIYTPYGVCKNAFLERNTLVTEKFINAINTPGEHILLYGPQDSGKKTFVANKIEQCFEDEIQIFCEADFKVNDILVKIFDQLNAFYVSGEGLKKSSSYSSNLTAEFLQIKAKLGANLNDELTLTKNRIVPYQLNWEKLAAFIFEAKSCLILYDFHLLKKKTIFDFFEKLKLFSMLSDKYPELKVIMIADEDTITECISNSPTCITNIKLDKMEKYELEELSLNCERKLNISFSTELRELLFYYSVYNVRIFHELALKLCLVNYLDNTQGEKKYFDIEHGHILIDRVVNDDLEPSVKYSSQITNAADILKLIAASPKIEGLTYFDIQNQLSNEGIKISKRNLGITLNGLIDKTKGILVKNKRKYKISSTKKHSQILMKLAYDEKNTASKISQRDENQEDLIDSIISATFRVNDKKDIS